MWQFLNLPQESSISSVLDEGRRVCSMTADELRSYNAERGAGPHGKSSPEENARHLSTYCFMTAYTVTLLTDGFGFQNSRRITFVDELDGYRVRHDTYTMFSIIFPVVLGFPEFSMFRFDVCFASL